MDIIERYLEEVLVANETTNLTRIVSREKRGNLAYRRFPFGVELHKRGSRWALYRFRHWWRISWGAAGGENGSRHPAR